MFRTRSNRKLRFKRLIALFTAVSLVLGIFCVYIDIRLRSVAETFARNHVSAVLTSAVNRAATQLLGEYNITYDRVSIITRNENDQVTSVEINTNEINKFKSGLTESVLAELSDYSKITFEVPLLAAFGIYYSYLSYPRISYTISISTVVSTEFKSEFTEAGINQVLHRISVIVGTRGSLAVLGTDADINETTDFTVAQTVIVGAVPDAFTSIDYANEDIVDDVFDYGAEAPK